MARITARNAGIMLDGRDISARSNSAALTLTTEAPEITSFTEGTRTRVPGGISDIELAVDGFWDSAASQVDEVFNSYLGASGLVGFFPAGLTACNRGREFTGILTEYTQNAAVADAMATSITLSGCAPLLDSKVLSAGNVEGSGASAAGAGVDYSGSASGTIYGILRYVSATGASTYITASLQDSANDSTWVTQALYTLMSSSTHAGTYQLQTSTSMARYRRFKYIVTGGSVNCVFTCGSVLVS